MLMVLNKEEEEEQTWEGRGGGAHMFLLSKNAESNEDG